MKYWNAIDVGAKSSAPTPSVEQETNHDDSKLDMLLELMNQIKDRDNTAPPYVENTVLNDDQINDVLTCLLGYQDKYFHDIPMTGQLVRQFMWNIPYEVYQAYKRWEAYELPDALNPLYWFYMFLTDDPSETMGKFLVLAINNIKDEDYNVISQRADEYDSYMNEDFDEED